MKNFQFSDWMSMARGANLPTVWTNVLAAWAINAGAGPSLRWMPEWTDMDFFNATTLGWLLLGASLIYAGGCFLNDACDYKFDQKNRPERPIPSGSLTLTQAWPSGFYKCYQVHGPWLRVLVAPGNGQSHCSSVFLAMIGLIKKQPGAFF